jgi:nicotinate-nucleotide adenylyltransferase
LPRIGVFGGSFNPVHYGHLLLADQLVELLDLERLLFVPAAWPPHKPALDLAPAAGRLRMIALAVDGHPRFEVSPLELERTGPSYTVDTLGALAARGTLHLVVGSDSFLDLLSWREPRTLVARARLVVVPRSGHAFDPEAPAAQKVLTELGLPGFAHVGFNGNARAPESPERVIIADVISLPVSGSELRRRAREGRSLAYRMPDAVAAYIETQRLYRHPRP